MYMYKNIYIYIYIHTYIHTYIHIHTYIRSYWVFFGTYPLITVPRILSGGSSVEVEVLSPKAQSQLVGLTCCCYEPP